MKPSKEEVSVSSDVTLTSINLNPRSSVSVPKRFDYLAQLGSVLGKSNFLGTALMNMNPEDRRKFTIKGNDMEGWCPSGDKLASFLKLDPKDFSIRKKEEK